MQISVTPLKTPVFELGQPLLPFLETVLRPHALEGKVVAITSKIVSLSEGAVVPKSEISRSALIKREADVYLGLGGRNTELTIKHGIMIPSAGIDESNAKGNYILYPKNPYAWAEQIWRGLRKSLNLKNLGVILTDSHTTPLRRGVNGIGLSHWGFQGADSRIGQPDLFSEILKYTHINTLDALASMAVFAMGEGNEGTPVAIVEGMNIEFAESSSQAEVAIEPLEDLYFPLLGASLLK
jgi:dihydrofolate synthase / folylpolyglutamate synthase